MNFDYIIIGAGSSGCVMANRLSASYNTTVLLLEAGGKDTNPWLHVPIGYYKTMNHPKFDWCYQTLPEEQLCNRSIKWPRGKTLGGSSAINGLIYIRGQKQDYDEWAKKGNDKWGYDQVLPYFLKSENHQNRQNQFHSQHGELQISLIRDSSEICDSFIQAAYQAGVRNNDDFNDGKQEGAGYFDVTVNARGMRCSAASAFLNPIKKRHNLEILTNAFVEKIIINENEKKATAVKFTQHGILHTAHAKTEIILCAGTIASPQILQISGIGNHKLLKKHGIKCIANLQGVGENLQDHLQIRPIYKTHSKTLNDKINSMSGKIHMAIEFLLKKNGAIATGVSQAGVFAKTPFSEKRPDIQFHIQRISTDHPGEKLHDFSAFTASACQLRPKSLGYVRINSNDPQKYPDIKANYLSDEYDQKILVEAMKLTRKIVGQPAIKHLIKNEHAPGKDVRKTDEILSWIRKNATTIYHPVGTCKMGNDKLAVVDQNLCLHGIRSLRVVDASIMPNIISGNTNAPAIMIAEKAADIIKADHI